MFLCRLNVPELQRADIGPEEDREAKHEKEARGHEEAGPAAFLKVRPFFQKRVRILHSSM